MRDGSVWSSSEAEPTPGFVALSRFVVANGMTDVVKNAFRERPHLVDHVPGYLRMDVISPIEHPDEIWLLTFWSDAPSFHAWHRGDHHRDSHRGIPKGLKLAPRTTELRGFEHVCS